MENKNSIRYKRKKKLLHLKFVYRIYDLFGDHIEVMSVYTDGRDFIKFKCSNGHNFKLTARSIYRKGNNKEKCPKCRILNTKKKNKPAYRVVLNKASFIKRARKKHGDKFNYDKFEYISSNTKSTITCPTHGDFEQAPANHYLYGCAKCAGFVKFTKEEFIKQARSIHGDKYTYDKFMYVTHKIDGIITCPVHGDFTISPKSHIHNKCGCVECIPYPHRPQMPTWIYLAKIKGKDIYKIGCTVHPFEKRFASELWRISLINRWLFLTSHKAYRIESLIIKLFKNYKYSGEPLLNNGNTELFTTDISQLSGFPLPMQHTI